MEVEDPTRDAVMMSLLVGGLTGQCQLSDEDRRAIGEWTVHIRTYLRCASS